MNPRIGLTRNVIRPHYALLTPDGHVASALPGWSGCTPVVLISGALGAGLGQYLITLEATGRGVGETEGDEWFVFVVSGKGKLNGALLTTGGFAYLPPGSRYGFRSGAKGTRLRVFRKAYEALAGFAPPAFFTG